MTSTPLASSATSAFPGHDDLDRLLERILPPGWIDAALGGDEATIIELLAQAKPRSTDGSCWLGDRVVVAWGLA